VCHLGSNRLSGTLPRSFGALRALQRLELFGNEFTGPIPVELGDAKSLQVVNLSANHLGGDVPVDALSQLLALRKLYLNQNRYLNDPLTQAAALLARLPTCVVSA
jgi:large subunit ribosomal protein L41